MGVWRKWIFPIIRIIIFAAIAAALVKIAFFADAPRVEEPVSPTASLVEPQIPVTVGTVRNDAIIPASVSADPAVPIKATRMGNIHKVSASQGATVKKGAEILVIREEVVQLDGSIQPRDTKVTAPAAGVVSAISVIVGESVLVGDVIGQVAPPTFRVSGPLPPEQRYRLLDEPTEAQVSILGGPAPFTCTGLAITTALEGAESGDGGGQASGTTVSCAVPPDVRVFPGLSAELVLAGGIAEGVLVAPTTAVEGTTDKGNVHVIMPDGSTQVRSVTLGLNDGFNVEIVDGLKEGDVILEFIPGVAGDGFEFPDEGIPLPDELVPLPIEEACADAPSTAIECGRVLE